MDWLALIGFAVAAICLYVAIFGSRGRRAPFTRAGQVLLALGLIAIGILRIAPPANNPIASSQVGIATSVVAVVLLVIGTMRGETRT